MSTPTNRDDIIDSRDLQEYFDEISEAQTDLIDAYNETLHDEDEAEQHAVNVAALASYWEIADSEVDDSVIAFENPADSFNGDEEVYQLGKFIGELEGYGDYSHGETIIRDSYFVEFAEQLADDIGAINSDAKWPLNHIDWEAAADSLKVDYMSAEWDGVEYWMRA